MKNQILLPIFPNLRSAQMSKLMKRTMESNNGCALPFKLRTQLEIYAEHDLDKGTPKIGNHVDVWVCKFKSLKGLFPKLVYNRDNCKQQASTFDPRSFASNIGLWLESTNVGVDHLQVSKGVSPKEKFKLKQLKATRWHRNAQTVSTPVNVPSSKDEDDYTIMGIVAKPTHEQNVSKLDTDVPSEN